MLSILIPTYNFSVLKLVLELHRQAKECLVVFEIRVYDDASTLFTNENAEINDLPECRYKILDENIGRSAIRNLLAKDAFYEHILFLDADTLPKKQNFIASYLPFTDTKTDVVFGGIIYQPEAPGKEKVLRWKYGRKREGRSVAQRQKNPYLSIISMAVFIRKKTFLTVNVFLDNRYGLDVLFSKTLEEQRADILHIDNPVVHLGLEDSATYLKKTENGLKTLSELEKKELIPENYRPLQAYALYLKKLHMDHFYRSIFSKFKKPIHKNLLSRSPSLFLFDLYRLGYFLQLKNEEHA